MITIQDINIIRHTQCKDFDTALEFVVRQYPWMFIDLESIELHPQTNMVGAFGLYHPAFKRVKISTGHDSILDYIDTIVHELIHHIQYTTNALNPQTHAELEREANNYAYLAVKEYKFIKGIPAWK